MSNKHHRKLAKRRRRENRIDKGRTKRQGGFESHTAMARAQLRGKAHGSMSQMPAELLHNAGLEHNVDACGECRRDGPVA